MDWEHLLCRAYPEGKKNSVFYSRGEHDDLRLGDIINTWDHHSEIPTLLEQSPKVIILGVPDDLGVVRAKGRPGARQGPAAIRRCFYRLTPGFQELGKEVIDLGDLKLSDSPDEDERLGETHLRLEEAVYYLALTGATVVILGGGQDLTYATVMGYTRAHRAMLRKARIEKQTDLQAVDWFGMINVDKFLDVRDPAARGVNSGTTIFRLLEDPETPVDGPNFVAFGIQQQHCSPRHRAYLKQQEARLVSLEQFWLGNEDLLNLFKEALDNAGQRTVQTMLSFDMNASVLAGVSSPSPLGFTTEDLCAMASMAGERGVGLMEIMETSPPNDDSQEPTARTAANMLFFFLQGLASQEPA